MTDEIILFQTASGPEYEQMLSTTGNNHRNYCERNDIIFRSEIGVRRGEYPWQATFNRIEVIAKLLDDGWRGWFMYLDADAVIRQPMFDIRHYLGKRQDHALIAAPALPDTERWDVNIGVFFLNLSHEIGREIGTRWYHSFHAIVTDSMLHEAVAPWQAPSGFDYFPDDQHLLHMILKHDTRLAECLLVDDTGLINGGRGRFIQQVMRHIGTVEERLAAIRRSVSSL